MTARKIGLAEIIDALAFAAARLEGEAIRRRDLFADTATAGRLLRVVECLDGARKVLELVFRHWPAVQETLRREEWRGRAR